MLSHAQDAPSPPPPSERFEGWYQALIFLVLMAGAGVFAVMATRVQSPLEALQSESAPAATRTELVIQLAAGPTRLLVFVDSPERAAMLRAWREGQPLLDDSSFLAIDISGPIPAAALEEAILFANAACVQEGCATVSVLDLRAADAP